MKGDVKVLECPPEEDNKSCERTARNVLTGAAEDTVLVWFGEKEAEG